MKPISTVKLALGSTVAVLAIMMGPTLHSPCEQALAHDGAPDMNHGTHSSTSASEIEVEIVVREGGQPFLKGQQTHGHVIALVAGQSTVFAFRNEDTVPREFVSPLFTRADIHFAGRATGIFRKDAVGFRLNPGSTLTLQFTAPYSGFPKMYDVIWCRHDHGSESEEKELQELLIVMTQDQ